MYSYVSTRTGARLSSVGVVVAGSSSGQSLEQAVLDFYAALGDDNAEWVPDLVVADDTPLVIGTDPTEWSQGFHTIFQMWTEARAAQGGTKLQPTRLVTHAFEHFGWAADEPTFQVGKRSNGSFRLTMIFLWHEPRWRLHHLHASIAVPDRELLHPEDAG